MADKYELVEKLASRRYTTVHKARDGVTPGFVTVKEIRYKKVTRGVPRRVIREVSILKELDHENIVRLLHVLPTEKEISLVFEYLDCNLQKFMTDKPEIARDMQVIKKFLRQILSGVAFCHSQKILHRDLKPQNILVDSKNLVVKLAGFAISREVGVPREAYTSKVATFRYKAPEILFDHPKYCQYSFPMDIWAVGCIFGEMVKGRQFFRGDGQINQMKEIFSVFGTPNEETWPGVTKLFPKLDGIWKFYPKDLAKEVPRLEPEGVDLLSKLFCLDPSQRITAHDALKHPYFSNL